MMQLADIRSQLLNNPSREFLVELINRADGVNPAIRSLVFVAIQHLNDKEVAAYSSLAAVAIQYLQVGDMEGLKSLFQRAKVPHPFIDIMMNYAANITIH